MKKPLINETKSGFTIVELSITMAFLAVLLISIAIITTNLIAVYQKGLTVKAVNSVGRSLTDNLTSAINDAPSVDTTSLCQAVSSGTARDNCLANSANKFIFQAKYDAEGHQTSGVFCTGHYSYLWNTKYAISDGLQLDLLYRDSSNNPRSISAPRLIRFEDPTHRACAVATNSNYASTINTLSQINIRSLASGYSNPIPSPDDNFLTEFDLDLTLYELTIFPISQDSVTYRTYVAGSFILGTERGDIDIQRTGDYCKVDDTDNLSSEITYCSINKFNFAARTAGM